MIRILLALAACLVAGAAQAQDGLVFKDPIGDDRGPGMYSYPEDPIYTPGSFDITELRIQDKGDTLEFTVTVNAPVTNPWRAEGGWSVQFPIIFISAGEIGGSEDIPGLNLGFGFMGWDYAVLVNPQPVSRIRKEIADKAPDLSDRLIIPTRRRAEGRSLIVSVPKSALPEGEFATWGYQVVMAKNDGFASGGYFLTRPVNELPGAHSFGGGRDDDCEPGVIDILTGKARAGSRETGEQYMLLRTFSCTDDGKARSKVTLPAILAE